MNTTVATVSLQNATSTPGVSARLASVELSEKPMTTPATASAPNVLAPTARVRRRNRSSHERDDRDGSAATTDQTAFRERATVTESSTWMGRDIRLPPVRDSGYSPGDVDARATRSRHGDGRCRSVTVPMTTEFLSPWSSSYLNGGPSRRLVALSAGR